MAVDVQTYQDTVQTELSVANIWRLSVDQYHRMIGEGILIDDDPVELLEGWLVKKMPKNPAHSWATEETRVVVARLLPAGWCVKAQEPITLADSEPEPDIVVVQGERSQYKTRHPVPQDIALVVEVADATLQRDRKLKLRIYAAASIPIYWLINLVDMQIEVYSEPTGPTNAPHFAHRQDYKRGAVIPLVIGEQEIGQLNVDDLLP